MLAPRPGGPVGVDLEVVLVDLDLARVLHHRRHLHAGEARLAAVSGVERGQTHEPVHAPLRPEQPVGVLAGGAEGGRLDPGFLALAHLQELDLKASTFGPAHQHPQHHLRPVLRVRSPGPGVDGHERVAPVVGTGEQPLLLERRQPLLDRGDLLLDLHLQRGVLGGHLRQPIEILYVRLQGRVRLQAPRGPRVLGRHGGRALGVVPEARRTHLPLERRDPLGEPSRVKDSPRAASSAHGWQPGAAGSTRSARLWPCPHAISAERPTMFPSVLLETPQQLSAAFAAAIRSRDLAAAVALWLDDALIVQPDGTAIQGRDAIETTLRALIENDIAIDIHLARVLVTGPAAVGLGTLTMRGQGEDGRPFEQHSQSAIVYARRPDGQWRLAIDAPWGLPKD